MTPREWITRGELAQLVELERRRERRARIRFAVIVGVSILFWALLIAYACSWGGTP